MKVLILDCETTGLIDNSGRTLDKQPQVIEFYGTVIGLEMVEGEVKVEEISELDFLANPGKPLPDIIKKITGLKDEDFKDVPPFGEYVNALRKLFDQADVATAHNLSFDKQLITFEMQRLNTELVWPAKLVCTG